MIKVTISKQNVITNQGTFKTQEEANSWVAFHESQESFGKPQHETKVLVSEAIPEVFDQETGEITQAAQEAVYNTVTIPAEYEIVIEDISAQADQDRINQEALAYLVECDWKRNRHISQKALGIETSLTELEYLEMEELCQQARSRIVSTQ